MSIVKRNKTQFVMAIVDPRVEALDRARDRARLSHTELCVRARVDASTWRSLRHGQQAPRPGTLKRIEAAIAARPAAPPSPIVALHRAIVTALALAAGKDAAAMLGQDFSAERPRDPAWLEAATLRRQAMYLAAVELEIPNADLGRALGCSRQNIKQARDAVEDARDTDAALDALLDRCAALLRGVR